VDIDRIDYLRDSARVYIYYFEEDWRNVGGDQSGGDDD
jgi:hypothetical protein